VASATTATSTSNRRAGTNTKSVIYWFLVGIAALGFLVGGRYHGHENTNTNVDHSLQESPESGSHSDIHAITATSQRTGKVEKETGLLRPNNVDIVQKATALDLSYVDVTRGPEHDLHRGVTDEAGSYHGGYVLDEQALRRNPPALNWTGDRIADACKLRDSEYTMIDKKISIVDVNRAAKKNEAQPSRPPQRILCVVQTSLHRHQEKIPVIRETWGCVVFLFWNTRGSYLLTWIFC